uniref:Uncharacterized protein n=1 Tax=Rhizophora mucronata TaxID=61149 RepID=A0A2P2P1R2_RHIMU
MVASSTELAPSSCRYTLLASFPELMSSAPKPASSTASMMWSVSMMFGSKLTFASSRARPTTAFLTPLAIRRALSTDSEQLVHAIPLILSRHTAMSCSGNSSIGNPASSMVSLICLGVAISGM